MLQHNRTTSTCYFFPHRNFVVMSARSTSAPSGVYHPTYSRGRHDNNGDDGVSIAAGRTMAGVGIEIQPEHQRALDETNKNELGCVNDYRRRISKVISWLEIEYHEYYDEVVSSNSATKGQ